MRGEYTGQKGPVAPPASVTAVNRLKPKAYGSAVADSGAAWLIAMPSAYPLRVRPAWRPSATGPHGLRGQEVPAASNGCIICGRVS